ncbi:MAG: hypothetical protein K2F76_08605 [Duncaniella dubosii]|nr:hypothetical protein [Duncaniella dubosii]
MKKIFTSIAVALLSVSAVSAGSLAPTSIPAFPGAEGFGRYTTGGRPLPPSPSPS